MTVATCFLLVLFVATATLVASLLIPLDKPEPHPFVTDPAETLHEHAGRHRHPADLMDGPIRPIGSSRLRTFD